MRGDDTKPKKEELKHAKPKTLGQKLQIPMGNETGKSKSYITSG